MRQIVFCSILRTFFDFHDIMKPRSLHKGAYLVVAVRAFSRYSERQIDLCVRIESHAFHIPASIKQGMLVPCIFVTYFFLLPLLLLVLLPFDSAFLAALIASMERSALFLGAGACT